MKTYATPPHVSWCITDDGAVFLDLKRDEYVAIARQALPALSQVVPELVSALSRSDFGTAKDDSSAAIAAELADQGILTDGTLSPTKTNQYVLPTESLFDAYRHPLPRINALHIYHLAAACLSSSFSMRYEPLERVVARIRMQKKRLEGRRGSCTPEGARVLFGVFLQLRPFFYTARDRCLFDSLVLTRFLMSHDVAPTLYFGVRTRPFTAHSWAQLGEFALNVSPDYARLFTPILAV